jgi:hypothetical protein
MRISEHWILVAGLLLIAAGFVMLHLLIGVPSEPTACTVGPMEASQCRAAGLERQPNGEWK